MGSTAIVKVGRLANGTDIPESALSSCGQASLVGFVLRSMVVERIARKRFAQLSVFHAEE